MSFLRGLTPPARRAFLAGTLILLFVGCSGKSEPKPIRLGHVAALTGADQAVGLQAKQGIELAVEDANATEGRVLDRPLEVIHGDTGSKPAGVRAVVVRLVQVNKVSGLLGGQAVADLDNLGTLTQSAQIPFLVASGGSGRPTGKKTFFTGVSTASQGSALGKFAVEDLKAGKVAVVSDGNAGRFEAIEAFGRELSAGQLIGRWQYDKPDKLAATVEEALERKPDLVLFAGPARDCVAARQAGLGAIPMLYLGDEGSLAGLRDTSLPTPLYLATAFTAEAQEKPVQSFVARYQKKYGLPPDVHAALAYDDTRLLTAALRKAEVVDADKVVEALHEVSLDGLTGKLTFGEGQALSRPVYIVKVIKGSVEVARKITP